MAMGRFLAVLLTLVLTLTLLPAAQGHTTYYTADKKYGISTGQLNEPATTYSKTGLDVCFTTNTTARAPVTINPGGLKATLVAPDGSRLSQEMRSQFGRPGCYQFQDAYYLTLPGQYYIELRGDLNGTMVDMKDMVAGGAVKPYENLTFPDDSIKNEAQLAEEDGRLRSELAAVKAELAAMKGQLATHAVSEGSTRDAPGVGLLLLVGLLGVAFMARRRQ